jgi:hypothetical protein
MIKLLPARKRPVTYEKFRSRILKHKALSYADEFQEALDKAKDGDLS